MTRLPETRDCALGGCSRAEHRGGVCRKHWQLIPWDAKWRAAADFMIATHEAGLRHREQMTALAREAVEATKGTEG